jgi:hypothetical protein
MILCLYQRLFPPRDPDLDGFVFEFKAQSLQDVLDEEREFDRRFNEHKARKALEQVRNIYR